MSPTETVLFLCTGNYYRSRLAEHYFNHLAAERGLSWRAESRGLELHPFNIGPISDETLRWLAGQGIALAEPFRYPMPATEDDFEAAALVIAVKEAEHRPLLQRNFRTRVDKVEFWHVHDLDVATPEEALPELAALVEALVGRLAAGTATA